MYVYIQVGIFRLWIWKRKTASKQGFWLLSKKKNTLADVQQNLTKLWTKLLWRNIRNYSEIQIKSYNFSLAAITGLNCNMYVIIWLCIFENNIFYFHSTAWLVCMCLASTMVLITFFIQENSGIYERNE